MLTEIGVALIFLGFLLVFIGVILYFIALMSKATREKEEKVEAAGILFIGPIPIVVGTSSQVVKIALLITIAMILMLILIVIF